MTEPEIKARLAATIYEARADKDPKITQSEMAKRQGLTTGQYNKYETGYSSMTAERFFSICLDLGISNTNILAIIGREAI